MVRQYQFCGARSPKMRRATDHRVLTRRAAARRRDLGANASRFEILQLLGDLDRRKSHVRHGGRMKTPPRSFCCTSTRTEENVRVANIKAQ